MRKLSLHILLTAHTTMDRAMNRKSMPAVTEDPVPQSLFLSDTHLLGNRYFGMPYSTTEVRNLFEVQENKDCSAAGMAQRFRTSNSYLNRILQAPKKKSRIRPGEAYLASASKVLTAYLVRKSNGPSRRGTSVS